MIGALKRRRQRRDGALAAYRAIVARARDPALFAAWSVPDTLDGRFELLALHAFLVMNRLKREPDAKAFAQTLFDIMFADLDRGVREMGATDLGVGRQVKTMARGFYGRVAAYDQGLADAVALEPALRRNLFGTVTAPRAEHIAAAAHYLRDQAAALAAAPASALLAGEVPFLPVGGILEQGAP